MQIKDLPASERPQEKLIYGGVETLSTSELIALIIRTGQKNKSSVQLADEVLAYAEKGGCCLGELDALELREIDGIGTSKACSIAAGIELAKRLSRMKSKKKESIDNPCDIADIVMDKLRNEKKEHLILFILNAKCEVESEITISIGDLSQASMNPREVLSPAIKRSAAAIIVAHNHPSGDPTPSKDDVLATKRLIEAAELMGIRVLDHIIVGDGRFISMRNEGIIRM